MSQWLIDETIGIRTTANGTWNAILFQFQLDFGQSLVLHSSSCPSFGLALYYVDEQSVSHGEVVNLHASCDGERFWWEQPDLTLSASSRPESCNLVKCHGGSTPRVRSGALPPWHFTMLHDSVRNEAYMKGMQNALHGAEHVLDAGAGSGLLSLMAAQLGASKVTAVERSMHIADVCEEHVCINGYQRTVATVCGDVRTVELESSADVLIMESFDNACIGEGCLLILEEAKRRLLSPGARILPRGAQLHCIPICMRLTEADGLPLQQLNQYQWTPTYKSTELRGTFGWTAAATEAQTGFRWDFEDMNVNDIQSEDTTLYFEAKEDCTVNAVAIWFTLEFSDAIQLCTSPFDSDLKCSRTWNQAVQMLPERRYNGGECIQIRAYHNKHSIEFELGTDSGIRTEVPFCDDSLRSELHSLQSTLMQYEKSCANDPFFFRAAAEVAVSAGTAPQHVGLDAEASSLLCSHFFIE